MAKRPNAKRTSCVRNDGSRLNAPSEDPGRSSNGSCWRRSRSITKASTPLRRWINNRFPTRPDYGARRSTRRGGKSELAWKAMRQYNFRLNFNELLGMRQKTAWRTRSLTFTARPRSPT